MYGELSRRETRRLAWVSLCIPFWNVGESVLFHSGNAFGLRNFRFELLMVVIYFVRANRGTHHGV
jgi:hypothetical protein